MRPVHVFLVAVYLVLIALGAALLLTAHGFISGVPMIEGWGTVLGLLGIIPLTFGLGFLGDLVWRLPGDQAVAAIEYQVEQLFEGGDEAAAIDEEYYLRARARLGPPARDDLPSSHNDLGGPFAQALD